MIVGYQIKPKSSGFYIMTCSGKRFKLGIGVQLFAYRRTVVWV